MTKIIIKRMAKPKLPKITLNESEKCSKTKSVQREKETPTLWYYIKLRTE